MRQHPEDKKQQDDAAEYAKTIDEYAIVHCGTSVTTTNKDMKWELYRYWSPNGYDRLVVLLENNFFDNSHFFRVVPHFLAQFGITYNTNTTIKQLGTSTIQDDHQHTPPIPFTPGTISYAGSGPNSRSSHLFIAFGKGSFGTELWETPVGRVVDGYDDIVMKLNSEYGDMPPWGKGPKQGPIYNGPQYIETNFPNLTKFTSCTVQRITSSTKKSIEQQQQQYKDEHEHEQEQEQRQVQGGGELDHRDERDPDNENHEDRLIHKTKLQNHHSRGNDREDNPIILSNHEDRKIHHQHNNKIHDLLHNTLGHDTEHNNNYKTGNLKTVSQQKQQQPSGDNRITPFSIELTTLCLLLFGGIIILWVLYMMCSTKKNQNPRKTK